jgi:cytoplasmic iron level regulating protein YaaA (DUF328/UPF0246 family)
MIAILSPAKTINLTNKVITNIHTQPVFLDRAIEIIDILKEYSPLELSSLMKINDELAETNFFRHIEWKVEHSASNSRQAILAYAGAVFQGLRAETFTEEQLEYTQEHVRILSGLYGLLRPLDLIQPYRLEMLTKLKNSKGKDLYVFWKETITAYLKEELIKDKEGVLLNLASKEYSSAIDIEKLNTPVITPVFKEYKGGSYKNITIYAKRARGLMVRYMVENNINSVEEIKCFQEEDYQYNEELSTEKEWVFLR